MPRRQPVPAQHATELLFSAPGRIQGSVPGGIVVGQIARSLSGRRQSQVRPVAGYPVPATWFQQAGPVRCLTHPVRLRRLFASGYKLPSGAIGSSITIERDPDQIRFGARRCFGFFTAEPVLAPVMKERIEAVILRRNLLHNCRARVGRH